MTRKEKENKEIVRHIFAEIGKGNHQPFLEAVAEDFTLTIIGKTFTGRLLQAAWHYAILYRSKSHTQYVGVPPFTKFKRNPL